MYARPSHGETGGRDTTEPPVDGLPPEASSHAVDRAVSAMYDELRQLARRHLRREKPGHTLRTTALVHEAYLRLIEQRNLSDAERTQLFAAASNTMRRVLVDHARRKKRLKRGGDAEHVPLDEVAQLLSEEDCEEIVAVDDALDRLAQANPRAAAVVQHRFFVGFSLEETADVLGVSSKTVQRDWIAARAWLKKEVVATIESP